MFSLPSGRIARLLSAACAASISAPFGASAAEPVILQEITVTGTREGELKSETPASVSVLRSEAIDKVQPAHPSELLNRVPGMAVMQTNGEGHVTGIRQPIGTAPVYLYLEDGIPTRASGFFNHNALYEVNLPQADSVEVTRGPGSALQGSDAIGGVVNVLTRPAPLTPEAQVTVEGGSYGWARFLGTAGNTWGDTGARGDLNLTHTDGWRDATAYDRQSATLRIDRVLSGESMLKAVVSATDIDQQTGATSALSRADWENDPTRNYTPIAFRSVKAFRASAAWEREDSDSLFSMTPYLRWNEMELMPSWALGYDPTVYTTGHSSLGLLAKYRHDFEPWRTRLITGLDLDYSPGFRQEDRATVTKSGPVFTDWTRGARIYDYDVTFMQASPYLHAETSPVPALRLTAGLRLDVMRYDYSNNMSVVQAGNWRRPESDTRDYTHLSPSLGATYAFTPTLNTFAAYKHSFRVPSESQLFRQGGNADSIHLEPVKVNSFEIGLRGPDKGDLTWEVSAYHMIKRDDILTVRDGVTNTSTNNGRTHHSGIEAGAGWRFLPAWRIAASGTYAEHTYEKWVARSGNTNVDYAGKDISTAPSYMGTASLGWQPQSSGLSLEAEWVHFGPYQMDEANTREYKGHDLFNLRAGWEVVDNIEIFGRVTNVLDTRWASSASMSGTEERFAPGMPRTFYAGTRVTF